MNVGDKAPNFKLPSSTGGGVGPEDFRRKWLVLYFYPKDDTSGCTAEACQFRDLNGEFVAAGAAIVGVSPDPLKSHGKFGGKYGLNFPLLADEGKSVLERYGVWNVNPTQSAEIVEDLGVIGAEKIKPAGRPKRAETRARISAALARKWAERRARQAGPAGIGR